MPLRTQVPRRDDATEAGLVGQVATEEGRGGVAEVVAGQLGRRRGEGKETRVQRGQGVGGPFEEGSHVMIVWYWLLTGIRRRCSNQRPMPMPTNMPMNEAKYKKHSQNQINDTDTPE